jgi:serine/threonine-protein kinase RsbT
MREMSPNPNQGECRVLPIRTDEDVVRLRQALRESMVGMGFSLIDQTKMITAASELARNALRYANGGEAHLEHLQDDGRRGVRLAFVDQGPGIANIEQAMQDGFTSGGGLGLGLGGAKRLADQFELDTEPGRGTTVTIVKWKHF